MRKLKKDSFIAYLLLMIGTVVYCSLIFNENIWLDEAFTATLIRTDFLDVIARSMQDTLPPLYNILLKLMTDIWGYHIQVMKITSILPMVFTMLLGATTVRRRFGNLASYLFIICLFTMPYLLFYGVEIRMYSWGFFFATGSGIFAYEAVKNNCRKNWIYFTLLSLGAGYTHHFAFVTVGFVYLFLLIYYIIAEREHIKRWFICLGATAVLYLPCLIVTLHQLKSVSGYFSMPDVDLTLFIKYMRYPFTVGNIFASIALLGLILLLLLRFSLNKRRTLNDWYALCCFIIYYGVLCFGTIISKIMTANIFVDRYLFFAFGFIWLFFAIEVSTLHKQYLAIILVFVLTAGTIGYVAEWKLEYVTGTETMLNYLDNSIEAGDGVISFEDAEQIGTCLAFYYPALQYVAVENVAQIQNNIWCVVTEDFESDFESFLKQGYDAEFQGDFRFDRYEYKLYLLTKN